MLTKDETTSVPVRPGGVPVLLSDAAVAAGLPLDLRCGGNGLCGRCKVEWNGESVLACQTAAAKDGLMHVPAASLAPEEFAVDCAFAPPVPRAAEPRCRRVVADVPPPRQLPGCDDWERLCRAAFKDDARPAVSPDVLRALPELLGRGNRVRLTILDQEVIGFDEPTQPEQLVCGVALDVGTTTVVVRLLDLTTGEQLALAGAQNRQVRMGANVLNRIALGSTQGGLDLLQRLVNEKTILPLLEKCLTHAHQRGATLWRAAVGGNTAMLHLFLGLSPKGLGTVPFNAVTLTPAPVPGGALKLPFARVECLPSAGAYIGGDALGGVYAVGLDQPGPPEMLIDIGTNTEMVLRKGNQLYAASAPAGPAFEGGGLSCGGPALRGAITHLRYEKKRFQVETYGGAAAAHLCGSAYIDFLAEGRTHGFLSAQGRFALEFAPGPVLRRGAGAANGNAGRKCELARGVAVDEHDISLLMQAKAAVLSGALILLRAAGLRPDELHALHVAGGFGRHLNAANALRVGLLPPLPLERIKVVGNTSLAAASSALLNSHAIRDMRAMRERVRVIELNLEPDYEENYINALAMP